MEQNGLTLLDVSSKNSKYTQQNVSISTKRRLSESVHPNTHYKASKRFARCLDVANPHLQDFDGLFKLSAVIKLL